MKIILIHRHIIIRMGIELCIKNSAERIELISINNYADALDILDRTSSIDLVLCQVSTKTDAANVKKISKIGITCITLLTTYSTIVKSVITSGTKVVPLYWETITPDILIQTILATQYPSVLNQTEVFQSVLNNQSKSIAIMMGIYDKLGNSHIDILMLIGSGKDPKEISVILNMVPKTVYRYLRELRDMLGVSSNTRLTLKAREYGFFAED